MNEGKLQADDFQAVKKLLRPVRPHVREERLHWTDAVLRFERDRYILMMKPQECGGANFDREISEEVLKFKIAKEPRVP